jgi:hypothetical protein
LVNETHLLYLLLAILGDFVCLYVKQPRGIALLPSAYLAHFFKIPAFLRIGETGLS